MVTGHELVNHFASKSPAASFRSPFRRNKNLPTATCRRSVHPLQRCAGTHACVDYGRPQILKAPATRNGTLGDLLVELSGLQTGDLQQLIDLGAIYYGDPDCPTDPPKWRRAKRLGPDAMDTQISEGQWLRVHPRPKRYPAASSTDWASTILFMEENICIVNKPAGIPVQAHESNSAETVPRCLERALGIQLWMLHRLDVCTTGVLVLACNETSARRFTADMTAHHIQKQYKALVYSPVETGTRLEHHMYNGPFGASLDLMAGEGLRARGPRLLSKEPRPRWQPCSLTVTDCREVSVLGTGAEGNTWLHSLLLQNLQPSPVATEAHDPQHYMSEVIKEHSGSEQHSESASSGVISAQGLHASSEAQLGEQRSIPAQLPSVVYECTIDLSSGGRTHQIRAQLSAVGSSLIGDTMYAPISGMTVQDGVADELLLRSIDNCTQIHTSIGLHAYSLTWNGRSYTAPPPWAQ